MAGLPATDSAAARAEASFPVLVPRPYLERIRPGDPRDPLLLQVLPQAEETAEAPGYRTDPLGEGAAACGPGLLWKYQGRLLIVAAGACGVHCRFCFRRHFPFQQVGCEEYVPRIAAEPSVREVIVSGGDPLVLPDEELALLAERLASVPHVTRLRIHTRLPIMIPQRVTDELLGWLRGTRLATLVVVHVNHPAEIDDAVAAALGRLVDAGVPVLSQAVLLAGVNNDVQTLAELYGRLADLRVFPYYLHQLDPVAGAAHFEVAEEAGRRLVAELRQRLPGYAVPRYVREVPGEAHKRVLL